MPCVLRIGAVRFLFYSNEGTEPPHIHVRRGGVDAKFWLDPVSLARPSRFSDRDLARFHRIVLAHREQFLEAWHDHFAE